MSQYHRPHTHPRHFDGANDIINGFPRKVPELSLRVLDHVRDHGRVSMGEIIRLTGASRNTLKQQLRQLVEKGHLVRHGGGRTTWYTLT